MPAEPHPRLLPGLLLALALCALGVVAFMSGCVGFVPHPPELSISFGQTNRGVLLGGRPMPDQGTGFVRARPGESTRFGTDRMVALIQRAAAEVAERFPGTAPLRVADLSAPTGGHHSRHGSHRSGRDVDLLFYLTDAAGYSHVGRGWLAFSRYGYGIEHELPGEDIVPNHGLYFFDDARNWHLVRTLLEDDEAGVQWIFCSRGVKARLLRYAIAHEPSPEILRRAAEVLHQPARAAPHDDHFHVRILCTPGEQVLGCRNRAPVWPWLRDLFEKPATPIGEADDDEALVRALMEAIEPAAEAPAEPPAEE